MANPHFLMSIFTEEHGFTPVSKEESSEISSLKALISFIYVSALHFGFYD